MASSSSSARRAGFGQGRETPKGYSTLSASVELTHDLPSILPGELAVALALCIPPLGVDWSEAAIERDAFGMVMKTPFKKTKVAVPGGNSIVIPWGRYLIKGLGAVEPCISESGPGSYIACYPKDGEYDISLWHKLTALIDEAVKTSRVFRGHAVKVMSRDDLLIPRYLDTTRPQQFIVNDDVFDDLNVCLFQPIENYRKLTAAGVRRKRGIILEGHYGVGKSLAAYVTAQKAVASGLSFISCAANLTGVCYDVARKIQPCVLFVEDLDSAAHGNRDSLNRILNVISSLDTKDAEVILLVSTNFIDRIDPAFLRPERIDAIIKLELPDASSVGKLIRMNAGDHLAETADDTPWWKDLCERLAGATPAIIAEVVERAKIEAVSNDRKINPAALLRFTSKMTRQRELAAPSFKSDTNAEQLEKAIGTIVQHNV